MYSGIWRRDFKVPRRLESEQKVTHTTKKTHQKLPTTFKAAAAATATAAAAAAAGPVGPYRALIGPYRAIYGPIQGPILGPIWCPIYAKKYLMAQGHLDMPRLQESKDQSLWPMGGGSPNKSLRQGRGPSGAIGKAHFGT